MAEEKKSNYAIAWSDLLEPTEYETPANLIAQLLPNDDDLQENDDQEDKFNDRGKGIVRDNAYYLTGPDEICKFVNTHEYGDNPQGKIIYYLTCCVYGCMTRRVIPDGYFGHYTSSERHMFVTAGVQSLNSCSDMWLSNIPMDDQEHRSNHRNHKDVEKWGRKLGSKYLVTVPENHLGGAYRIGKPKLGAEDGAEAEAEDGQFILLKKGRHVLDAFKYKDVQICSLERNANQDKVELGPITILYLKDGQLGGAFDIWAGTYKIFYPGAPLLLHNQDFRDISSIKTSLKPYKLGPYTFVTVQEGFIAGAYSKQTGQYHILPPGETYWLHSKDWEFNEEKDCCEVQEKYDLGPYMYVTVLEGFAAGVFHKKSGMFIELPEGQSYRLSIEDYERPVLIKKNTHKVECGPITYLTVENGTLNGAYSILSGKFEEFDNQEIEYKLHAKEYRDISSIDRNTNFEQKFGFFKVITIPEGSVGVFEKNGVIVDAEHTGPGYYKLTPDHRILPMIAVNTNTLSVPALPFKTKDGIAMEIASSLVWFVSDSKLCSLITPSRQNARTQNPSFNTLKDKIKKRLELTVVKYIMKFNRDELLPTKQDIALKYKEKTQEELEVLLEEETQITEDRCKGIEQIILDEMKEASLHSQWGVNMDSMKVEGFELIDRKIADVLAGITETIVQINKEKVQGDLALAQEQQKMFLRVKETEIQSNMKIEKANADAGVQVAEAKAAADVAERKATTNADDAINAAQTENRSKVFLITKSETASRDARATKLAIETRETLSAAEADAQSITLLAEADYERQLKENLAIEKMSKKQYNIVMSQHSVAAMNALGDCAWRMPDKVLEFYNEFEPLLT